MKKVYPFKPSWKPVVGACIMECMEFMNLSKEEFASKLEISTSALEDILNDVSYPTDLFTRLSEVIDVDPDLWLNLEKSVKTYENEVNNV
jgi:plasmid maintenance system antidote protein VapI